MHAAGQLDDRHGVPSGKIDSLLEYSTLSLGLGGMYARTSVERCGANAVVLNSSGSPPISPIPLAIFARCGGRDPESREDGSRGEAKAGRI